jgi:hypothetical protein
VVEFRDNLAPMDAQAIDAALSTDVFDELDNLHGESALAALTVRLATFNRAIELGQMDPQMTVASDLLEKLTRWVQRLRRVVARIAHELHAVTYSINVGTAVSISMAFSVNVE